MQKTCLFILLLVSGSVNSAGAFPLSGQEADFRAKGLLGTLSRPPRTESNPGEGVLTEKKVFNAQAAYAKEQKSVSGRVLDVTTGKPIPYASVSLLGKLIGTITNEAGDFHLNLPTAHHDDTLAISCIGYQTHRVPVAAFWGEGSVTIQLQPASIRLAEVVVRAKKGFTAKEIVQQARLRIPDNYPVQPYASKGYFKKYVKMNGKYAYFVDAAVRIYDKGYTAKEPEKVVLEAARRSHLLTPKPFENFNDTKFVLMDNSVSHLLAQNFVRYQNEALNLDNFQYRLDSTIHQEQDTLYVITASVQNKSKMPFFRKHNTLQPAYQLFIHAGSYAIHKITYEPVPMPVNTHRDVKDLSENRAIDSVESYLLGSRFELVMEYKKHNGKMFPSYIYTRSFVNDYNKKTQRVDFVNEYVEELVTNQVMVDEPLPPTAVTLQSEAPLEEQAPPYNPSFWSSYQTVNLEYAAIRRDLGEPVPLEEQFKIGKAIPDGRMESKAERRRHMYRFFRRE